jgi:quinol monooxygenase YgiN
MPALLIARFRGDVEELTRAYDRAHKLIMDAGGPPGELRHHCATSEDSLYLVGVWESEEVLRTRFASEGFRRALTEAGFPSPDEAEVTILRLHAIEPPLPAASIEA